MFAINIDENNRILRATYERFADAKSIIVNTLPERDITEYLYVDGEFIYEPMLELELDLGPLMEEPTQLDRIEAQVMYTAMITDTLLEG